MGAIIRLNSLVRKTIIPAKDMSCRQVNGEAVSRGTEFRYGHRYELDGATLLVWIKRQAESPITIQLTSVK